MHNGTNHPGEMEGRSLSLSEPAAVYVRGTTRQITSRNQYACLEVNISSVLSFLLEGTQGEIAF